MTALPYDQPPDDGTGRGIGPSGAQHRRFRAWKEDLRDAGRSEVT